MNKINNLIDFMMAFWPDAQTALDFLADEINQHKFKRFLALQSEASESSPNQNVKSDKETKIRIAIDGGKFITKEEWFTGHYSKDDVIGIAVITPVLQFILGLREWKESWSDDTDNCITGEHNEAQAYQILSGYEHTKQIVEVQEDEGDTAAKLCWNYGHKGLQWYMPCLLELNAVCVNKEEINELLKLVGGDPLSFDECYWSSIEHSAHLSWYVNFYYGHSVSYGKCYATVVRPAVAI